MYGRAVLAGTLRRLAALLRKPPPTTRYEAFWDRYARAWHAGALSTEGGEHLGSEWGSSAGTAWVFERLLEPHLGPSTRVLEIGPGGGKYSALVAPRCAQLVCADASGEMLERTRQRLGDRPHVRYLKVDGRGGLPLPPDCFDFFFSIDVFVHFDMETFYRTLREVARVLRPGGIGTLSYAVLLTEGGWAKFVAEIEWDTDGMHAPFGFLTEEILRAFMASAGLAITWHDVGDRDGYVVFRKAGGAGADVLR